MKSYAILFVVLFLISSPACSSAFQGLQPDDPLKTERYGTLLWSPDGRYLALYNYDDRRFWIFDTESQQSKEINVQGEGRIDFYGADWQNNTTLWLPLRHMRHTRFYADTVKVDITTGETELIFDDSILNDEIQVSIEYLSFDPSGQQLAISGSIPGYLNDHLALVDIETKEAREIVVGEKLAIINVKWSPDGTKIFFQYWPYDDTSHLKIGIYYPDSGRLDSFEDDTGSHRFSCSPDSQHLLYTGGYQSPGLNLFSIEDQSSTQVLNGDVAFVSWSDDGSKIAFTTVGVPGRNELYITSPEELGMADDLSE